jgi:Flp pilus assembly pilin Flp
MKRIFMRFFNHDSRLDALEYALMAALIAIALIGALQASVSHFNNLWGQGH